MEPAKVFVGGISWDTNDNRLREYFQAFGDVVEAVIMKDRTTGRARGFGFVVFADPSVAEIVVREKHIIDGRTVEAKKAVPRDDQQVNRNNGSIQGSPAGPARTKKIFVGGLASSVTESDFKNYFDQFGTITDVVVMYDHNTQRPRGFGFITYDSEEAVDEVLCKTFHELNGKMVEVKRAVPKESSPGPTQSQLGRYSHGMNRVNNLVDAYAQPSLVGSYGVGMEGKYTPLPIGRNGYSAEYISGIGVNSRYNGNLSSSVLGYGRNINSNRYNVPIGRVGNGSLLNSTVLENESLYYANNREFVGSGTWLSGAFGGLGTIWGSSPFSGGGDEITFSNRENRFVGGAGYGRNAGSNAIANSSYAPTQGVHATPFGNIYGSIYEDSTWRASSSEQGSADSLSYFGGYSGANRSTRGIAA